MTPSDKQLSTVANALGYEMLRHDGRSVTLNGQGVGQIEVSQEEADRCLVAAQRVLDHLDAII